MTKIAKTAATAIALSLAAHASGAYAANIATPSKVSTVTPVAQKATVPCHHPRCPEDVPSHSGWRP
jgi:hypothetical protein